MRIVKRPREQGGPAGTLLPANPLVRAFIRAADELLLAEDQIAERNRLLTRS